MIMKTNVSKILCLLILVGAFLVACVPDAGYITETKIYEKNINTTFTKIGDAPSYGVFRVEDKEKSVTCWLNIGTENSSISCMPNHEMLP